MLFPLKSLRKPRATTFILLLRAVLDHDQLDQLLYAHCIRMQHR